MAHTDYIAGGPVTAAERAAVQDGIKAGAILRERELAAGIAQTSRALESAGLPHLADYRMPPTTDPETGEPVQRDARAILAAAESAAGRAAERKADARLTADYLRKLRDERPLTGKERRALAQANDHLARRAQRGRWTLANRARMTAADVARMAAYGKRCAERMARPALTVSEAEDVEAEILTAILARPVEDTDAARRWLAAPYGTPRADCRLSLAEGTMSSLPLWDSLTADDVADAPHRGAQDGARAGDRWRAFAYVTARRLVHSRAERLSAEHAADWSDSGEDAPTPEQRAAAAADAATAALTGALDSADLADTVDALDSTAPGETALRPAERDALALALSGRTRAQIAAARGVTADALKKGAQRGRKHLLERAPDAAALRGWVRQARAAERDDLDAILAYVAERDSARIQRVPHAASVRLVWTGKHPDGGAYWQGARLPAVVGADATYVIPPAPQGRGQRASDAITYGCAERAPLPRRTRSGAPTLPAHHLLAPLARTTRILATLPARPTADAPNGASYTQPNIGRPNPQPAPRNGNHAWRTGLRRIAEGNRSRKLAEVIGFMRGASAPRA